MLCLLPGQGFTVRRKRTGEKERERVGQGEQAKATILGRPYSDFDNSKLWWQTTSGPPRDSKVRINLLDNLRQREQQLIPLHSRQLDECGTNVAGIAALFRTRALFTRGYNHHQYQYQYQYPSHNHYQNQYHTGGQYNPSFVISKLEFGEHDDVNAAERGSTAITTYFHSYSFVPGGAVPLPPALHSNHPSFTGGHHLFGQQGCSLACTCTCTCTASIVSAAAAAHHPQLHQHHRALGTASSATVLLQPVDQIKDAMVSNIYIFKTINSYFLFHHKFNYQLHP